MPTGARGGYESLRAPWSFSLVGNRSPRILSRRCAPRDGGEVRSGLPRLRAGVHNFHEQPIRGLEHHLIVGTVLGLGKLRAMAGRLE